MADNLFQYGDRWYKPITMEEAFKIRYDVQTYIRLGDSILTWLSPRIHASGTNPQFSAPSDGIKEDGVFNRRNAYYVEVDRSKKEYEPYDSPSPP